MARKPGLQGTAAGRGGTGKRLGNRDQCTTAHDELICPGCGRRLKELGALVAGKTRGERQYTYPLCQGCVDYAIESPARAGVIAERVEHRLSVDPTRHAGVDMYDEPWALADALWFQLHPDRRYRSRRPFPGELEATVQRAYGLLTEPAVPDSGNVLVLVHQDGVGRRMRAVAPLGDALPQTEKAIARRFRDVARDRGEIH